MSRTRTALLAGAAKAVRTSGTKITMAQVATEAGVAKATLYNHFRTRDAVLEALLAAEVAALLEDATGLAAAEALWGTAVAISAHPVRAGLAQLEPQTLAGLAQIRHQGTWADVEGAVAELLEGEGRGGAGLVVRWLASFLVAPAEPQAIRDDVDALFAGLPTVPIAAAS